MVVDCIDERRQGKRDEEEKPVTKHEIKSINSVENERADADRTA